MARVVPNKTHTALYYHGIDPDTLRTMFVSVTHGCRATRHGGGKPTYSFPVPSLRESENEVRIVVPLQHVFKVPIHLTNDPITKRRLEELEARAAVMREGK
jgi:hypothetical protein